MNQTTTKPLACEKCGQGAMEPKKLFRLSGCLVAIGYFLLTVSFGCLGLSCVIGLLMLVGAGTTATAAVATDSTKIVIEAMQKANCPKWSLDEVRSTGRLSEASQEGLTQNQRNAYLGTVAGVAIGRAGGVAASGMAGLLGVGGIVAAFCTGIPSFIVGFLLVLKRKVMACNRCGYLYDVA